VPDPRDDLELQRTLVELVGLLPADESYEQTLQRVVELAQQTISGCDSASITLLTEGPEPGRTIVRTDGLALRIDEFQYQNDDGPCLEASREKQTVEVVSMRTEERWGPFPSEAIRHGVESSLSSPLSVRGQSLGALNLYSRTEAAYTDSSREIARLFASQASVAVANAQVYEASRRLTEQMQEAMRSRAIIEQAKGILMAERSCDEDTAFDLLRAASQRQNVKLREVAQRLVDSKGEGRAAP
jgi:GAF domain-containing protein